LKKGFKFKLLLGSILALTVFSTTLGADKAKEERAEKQVEKRAKRGLLANIVELKEISDIMDIVLENHVTEKKIDKKSLMHGAIKGMMQSLDDSYSVYMTKKELDKFNEDITGEYAGVGMVIQKKIDEPLEVVSPVEDTPAFKAGIKPKDKIVSIDGKPIYSLTDDKVIKMLRGKEGTKVKVTLTREGVEGTKEIELERQIINLKYVKHKMLNKKDKIGFLRITQFGENVHKDVEKSLTALKKQGMKGLILDLRSNPGGSLEEAIRISSYFLKKGKVVSVKGKVGGDQVYNRKGKYYGDFPMVILVDQGSASASEIVSGALKDHKRALLLGEKTFGKGLVQSLIPLPDGDGIKLTIAQYFTPSGAYINKKGIEPDVKISEPDGYLFNEGFITNVDETASKENRDKIIEKVKGKEEAKKLKEKEDVQLKSAEGILKGLILKK